jgi:chromate transporter
MSSRPSLIEIFIVALRLGCTSFGGPIAHLAYFRKEYVERLRWLDEAHYADLVALCQFLPGPASSQTGFGIGYLQRGMLGGVAAWVGFTLPSALLMIAFAYGVSVLGNAHETGWLRGLKVVSVAVVAQAVWAMARSLCPDWARRLLALVAAAIITWLPFIWIQVAILAVSAGFGFFRFRETAIIPPNGSSTSRPERRQAIICLGAFFLFLMLLPALACSFTNPWLDIFDRFYRSGALVFGGGHAVLPLLEQQVVAPGWLSHDQFLAGYGAVQAMPGPLFTLSAYLGTLIGWIPAHAPGTPAGGITVIPAGGWLRGLWALIAIFLPALLLVAGTLPFWQKLRYQAGAQAALRGANAAVVGVLLAALYHPVWTGAIINARCVGLAVAAFIALQFAKMPVWAVVVALGALGQWWL